MGLQAAIQRGAQTAFKAAGDIPIAVTYYDTDLENINYRPASGRSVTYGNKYENLKFIFEKFSSKEISASTFKSAEDHILKEDEKALIPANNLVDDNGDKITPLVGHIIMKSNGEYWKVVNPMTDPVTALWILHIRRTDIGSD